MLKYLLATILFATPIISTADESPPIDMTAPLIQLNGQPFADPAQASKADPDCSKCGPLTLGSAIAEALCANSPDVQHEDALAKFRACSLGERLQNDKAAHLTAAEVTQIEARLGLWSPGVLVKIIPVIDPNQASAK